MHVGDGVDNCQIALDTCEEVKQSLSWENNTGKKHSRDQHRHISHVNAQSIDERSKNTKKLHEDHVEGEEVGVAGRLRCRHRARMPPSLESHVEDEDVERQEEEVDEGVDSINDFAGYEFQAFYIHRRVRGVEGGRFKRGVEGGRRVGGHDL